LSSLNLSNNMIESVDLKDIMVNIKSLDLSFNQIDESSLASIHLSFNRLIEINLAGNNFDKQLDKFIVEFTKYFKCLRSL
jgi:PIN domain nuclease of toxin-antitoxin system